MKKAYLLSSHRPKAKITTATAISARVKGTPRRPGAAPLTAVLSTKDATGPHRQGDQQDAERDRRCPGRAEERRGQALGDAERHRRDHHAGEAAQPAQHADGEDAADIFTPDRRLHRLDDATARPRPR